MDKKVGVVLLFSFFLILGLFGVTKVAEGAVDTTNTNLVFFNTSDLVHNDTVAIGGERIIVNLTVVADTTAGESNYTNITISWPASNFTFISFLDPDGQELTGIDDTGGPATSSAVYNNSFVSNATIWAREGQLAPYNITNLSSSVINAVNDTALDVLGINSSNDQLMIRFLVETVAAAESLALFTVTIDDVDASETTANNTDITTYIDGVSPVFNEINITDGNNTYSDTSSQEAELNVLLNEWRLSSDADLTVTIEVEEAFPITDDVKIYYNTSLVAEANVSSAGAGTSAVIGTMTQVDAPRLDHAGVYSFTVPKTEVIEGGSINFVFLANDTFNQVTAQNNSATGAANATYAINTNVTVLDFVVVNLTSGSGTGKTTTLTSTTGQLGGTTYLPDNSFDMWVEVSNNTDGPLGLDSFVMYYNSTGPISVNSTLTSKFSIGNRFIGFEGELQPADAYSTSATNVLYNFTNFPIVGNDTNTFNFILAANATDNFTVFGEYSFKIDGSAPSEPTLTVPAVRTVEVSNPTGITYTCSADDAASGIGSYDWKLIKPGSDEITREDTTTVTWSGDDINQAGEYIVDCTANDLVGHKTTHRSTSLETFNAIHGTSSSGSSSGGGGSSGTATPTVSFDVDFSEAAVGSIKAQQGRIKSFSFDGNTKHTMTFNEVTASSVTVTIASTPITVSLDAGQTKEVDINFDAINDMSVTLKSIVNGLADIEIKKIEAGARVVAKEEREAAGIPEPTDTTTTTEVTPVQGGSNVGLWVTLLVIVAVIVIGYLSYRKK